SRRPLAVPLLLFSSSSYPDPRQLPAFPTRRSSDLLVDAVDEALGASSGPLRRPRHDRGHRHGRLRAPPPARPPRDDPPAAPLLRAPAPAAAAALPSLSAGSADHRRDAHGIEDAGARGDRRRAKGGDGASRRAALGRIDLSAATPHRWRSSPPGPQITRSALPTTRR